MYMLSPDVVVLVFFLMHAVRFAAFRRWLWRSVRFSVEVGKKGDKRESVDGHGPVKSLGEGARCNDVGDSVDHHNCKLSQLQSGEVFFPPQVWLPVGAKSRQAVVGVHHNVNCRVQQRVEKRLAASNKGHAQPPVEDHGGVVIHVEEGNLPALLPQDKEHRISKFNIFRDIIQPTYSCHP
eukprot:GHVL01006104.1.p2 GENE.GHVL01006104.1~~GHVL01006104.1.p2  ORF type:complete len:180 (-),score=11.73 GHVL01006104.1:277-816(-)